MPAIVDLIPLMQNDNVRSRSPYETKLKCKVCDQTTTHKKPFCIDHLKYLSDYVHRLIHEKRRPEDEALDDINDMDLNVAIRDYGIQVIHNLVSEGHIIIKTMASVRQKAARRRIYVVSRETA